MKKVYVVNGIHDGILAVCSNVKRAYEVTEKYNDNGCNESEYERISYSQMTKTFQKNCMAYNGDATVEMMWLNYFPY